MGKQKLHSFINSEHIAMSLSYDRDTDQWKWWETFKQFPIVLGKMFVLFLLYMRFNEPIQ